MENLKAYFAGDNVLKTVRNRHGFHYAPDQIAAGYAGVTEGDPLEMYLSEANAKSLYTFADTIGGRALLHDIDPSNHIKAFERLVDETAAVIGWLNQIIAACLLIAITKYIAVHEGKRKMLDAETIEVKGAPHLKEVRIPYFVETD